MSKIKLSKEVEIKGKMVSELQYDLSGLTGRDCITAQKIANEIGIDSGIYEIEKGYHAALAAIALKLPIEDLLDLPIIDFSLITMDVQSFLYHSGM